MAELNPLQHLLETTIKQIPQLLLENRLTEKFKESGLTITQAAVRRQRVPYSVVARIP